MYQTIRMHRDVAMGAPATLCWTDGRWVEVTKVYIPQDIDTAEVRYFVDTRSGDHLGQFPTEEAAIELAAEHSAFMRK